jgi:hypothetical protein
VAVQVDRTGWFEHAEGRQSPRSSPVAWRPFYLRHPHHSVGVFWAHSYRTVKWTAEYLRCAYLALTILSSCVSLATWLPHRSAWILQR